MPDYPSTAGDIFEKRNNKGRPNGYAALDASGMIIGTLSSGLTGPTGPAGPAGPAGAAWSPVQSGAAPATATGGTIAAAALTVSRVAPTAAITGVIMAAGTIAGQQIVVLNESSFGITFASSGTSNVASGTGVVIAGATCRLMVWDSLTSLWYANGALVGVGGGGSIYDTDVYDTAVYA